MVSNKVFIGCDPGKEGAITYLYPDNSIETVKFPLIAGEYDIKEFENIFIFMSKISCHLVIEDVKALQKPFDSGNWYLSRGKAILETLAIVYNISHTLVHSKTWQKEMWQGVPEKRAPSKTVIKNKGKFNESSYIKKGSILTKEMSLLAIKRLFPTAEIRDPDRKTERSKKPHDGVIDSILMAEYCRRKFK